MAMNVMNRVRAHTAHVIRERRYQSARVEYMAYADAEWS